MKTTRQADPVDHAYTVTVTFHSLRPYTTAELERLPSWWMFIKDRQVAVMSVHLIKKEPQ